MHDRDVNRRDRVWLGSMLVAGIALGVGARRLLPDAGATAHLHHGVGTINVDIRDDTGPIPARLTFRPVGDTAKLFFTTIDIAREEVGAVAAFDRAFVLRGEAEIRVPAGTYDISISHGIEWDAATRRITVADNGDAELAVHLHHVVDTPGWISGDFHVHAAPSLDSRVPMRDRIYQFVADGVDLIVSTDHNVVSDYKPLIAELGVTDLLASATGDEITSKPWGHFGAFPLPDDPDEVGHGAPATGKHTPQQIFAETRAKAPAALIDIHHPRLENGSIGYFHLSGYDETTGKAARAGFSFDFDAIEVLNGYQDPDRKSVNRVIGDWISFLDRGKRVAATGNSDSHHLTFNLGGFPRNYVNIGNVPIGQVDPAAVAAAVKAGHSFLTTGPIVDATIDNRSYGETCAARDHKVALVVRVRAAPWISTTKLTVLGTGGAVLAQRVILPSTEVVRFSETIALDVAADGYVIIRVDGDVPMAPNVGDLGSFKVYPLAITNPIWIDSDGDGKITPTEPPLGG